MRALWIISVVIWFALSTAFAQGTTRPGRDPLPPPVNEEAKRKLAETNFQAPEPRFALVVGNSNYVDRRWRLSQTPISDADVIVDALEVVGFDVALLADATGEQLETSYEVLLSKVAEAGSEAIGLVYYAGHNFWLHNNNRLAPVDLRPSTERGILSSSQDFDELITQLDDFGRGLNFVFVDGARQLPEIRRYYIETGMQPLSSSERTWVAASTEIGATALEAENNIGFYAEAFSELILSPSLTTEDLFDQISGKVQERTGGEQSPAVLAQAKITRDFCFAGCEPIFTVVQREAEQLVDDKSGEPLDVIAGPQIVLGGPDIDKPGPSANEEQETGPLQIVVDAYGPGPYKSISKAVKDIAEGGIIYVRGGLYNESIVIDKDVALVGEINQSIPVEVNAPMNASCLRIVSKSNTSHVIIDNIQFAAKFNSAEPCITVDQGYFTLRFSDVIGPGVRPAIVVQGGRVHIESSRISAGSEGIQIQQANRYSATYLIDNKILHNKIGVDISSGTRGDVIVTGNEVFENLDSGIKASGLGAIKIFGNTIRGNEGSGIVLDKYHSTSVLRFNEIAQNSGDGIAAPFGLKGVIEGNNIVGNDGISIFVRDGVEPKITSNMISNNDGDDKRAKKRRR